MMPLRLVRHTPIKFLMKHLHSDSRRSIFFKRFPELSMENKSYLLFSRNREQTHTVCCIIQISPCVSTWMRLAAGFLLFSKCFCRCCSCTFRANPDPSMPCEAEHTLRHKHTHGTLAQIYTRSYCVAFRLQLVKQRRRSPEEQSQLIITVRSTSAGSYRRNLWL